MEYPTQCRDIDDNGLRNRFEKDLKLKIETTDSPNEKKKLIKYLDKWIKKGRPILSGIQKQI